MLASMFGGFVILPSYISIPVASHGGNVKGRTPAMSRSVDL
jgi:hypothetical protein